MEKALSNSLNSEYFVASRHTESLERRKLIILNPMIKTNKRKICNKISWKLKHRDRMTKRMTNYGSWHVIDLKIETSLNRYIKAK